MNDICKLTIHRFGEHATHSLARLERRLTVSLLLAGNGPASSALRAELELPPLGRGAEVHALYVFSCVLRSIEDYSWRDLVPGVIFTHKNQQQSVDAFPALRYI